MRPNDSSHWSRFFLSSQLAGLLEDFVRIPRAISVAFPWHQCQWRNSIKRGEIYRMGQQGLKIQQQQQRQWAWFWYRLIRIIKSMWSATNSLFRFTYLLSQSDVFTLEDNLSTICVLLVLLNTSSIWEELRPLALTEARNTQTNTKTYELQNYSTLMKKQQHVNIYSQLQLNKGRHTQNMYFQYTTPTDRCGYWNSIVSAGGNQYNHIAAYIHPKQDFLLYLNPSVDNISVCCLRSNLPHSLM